LFLTIKSLAVWLIAIKIESASSKSSLFSSSVVIYLIPFVVNSKGDLN